MPTKVHFKNIKEVILYEIKNTKIRIDVAVAWITEPDIINELEKLLNSNISVRIIAFDDRINNTDTLKRLYFKGAQIKLSTKLMHNKFCIIDSKTVVSGSFNWTINASRNDENVTVNHDDVDLIKDFGIEFTNLWSKSGNIEGKLKVNKYNLNEIDDEFDNMIWNIKQYNFPVLYLVEIEKIGREFQYNKYGRLEKGVYLIQNEEDLQKDFKYIFYIEKGLDLRELENKTGIHIDFNLEHFTSTYPYLKDKKIIEINPHIYVLKTHNNRYGWGQIYGFNNDGMITEVPSKVVGLLDNNRLLIADDIGYKILFENGNILDFQSSQRDSDSNFNNKEFNVGGEVKIIEGKFFCASVLISKAKSIKRDALYNYDGEILTRPIFNHLWSFNYKEEGNKYIFKEYAVAYCHKNYVKFLGNNPNPLHIYREVILDLKIMKLFKFGAPKLEGNNPHREKLGINENTKLFFVGDEKYGLFNQAIYILKADLKIIDYNLGVEDFLKSTFEISHDNEKVSIAINIVSNYLAIYKAENERLIEENKEQERIKLEIQQKKDKCYLATCVYGGSNHPHTIEFRKFRDEFLNHFFLGRLFIKIYYSLSPKFVEYIHNKPKLKNTSKYIIEKIRLKLVQKIIK